MTHVEGKNLVALDISRDEKKRSHLTIGWISVWAIVTLWAGSESLQGQESSTAQPGTIAESLENRLPEAALYASDEVIVKLKGNGSIANGFAALSLDSSSIPLGRGEILIRLHGTGLNAMEVGERVDTIPEIVEFLSSLPEVEYAQPNFYYQAASTPVDPYYPQQWSYFEQGNSANQALGGIGLPTAWETTQGGNVVVAVIDTGILKDHPEISTSANVLPGYDMISELSMSNDNDGRDANPFDSGDATKAGECGRTALGLRWPLHDLPASWHGTHVAGTIGVGRSNDDQGMAGIAWKVSILPVRVLGRCGAKTRDINDAIRWAAGLPVLGAPLNPHPAKVINLSLGGFSSCAAAPTTQSAIDDAIAAGATIVVAAGNEHDDASKYTPASCKGVITVAASDFRGQLAERYSNFGPVVDILAPGGDVQRDDNRDGLPDGILSLVKGGHEYYNGTSMAAPHVAGVIALLLSVETDLTPAQVEAKLKNHARPRTEIECPKPCGAGLLDASFLGPSGRPEGGN
jgi:serine protease